MRYSALILGASGDIGQAICRRLAAQGWSLYLHYFHQQQRVTDLQLELQRAYPRQDFFTLQADLTDETVVPALLQQLFQVDAVVFAEGITTYQLLQDTSSQQIETLWQLHVKTPMLLCQQLNAKLSRSTLGRIVFIGSIYGGSGSPMEVAYSTVKGAQSAFANAYAREVASLGITVNVVAPGAVDTQMNHMFSNADQAQLKADIPLGRMAQPNEIAYWVQSLLAPEADYLTGQTLYVSGGWLK